MIKKYVVIFIDHFTKYPEAFAITDQKAETIAELLFTEIICRYGAPKVLLSDCGTNFLSDIVTRLCEIMEIRKATSTAYAPQTQGQVERTNRTVQDMLAKLIEDHRHQSDWDVFLPAVLFAIRNSPNRTTKETPQYLLFGQDARLPVNQALNYQGSIYRDFDGLVLY